MTSWRTTRFPKYVRSVDSFPMTVSGKVRKIEMRAWAIDELGLASMADRPYA